MQAQLEYLSALTRVTEEKDLHISMDQLQKLKLEQKVELYRIIDSEGFKL